MKKKTQPPHPIQPLVKDDQGTLRFKQNAIVNHLYEVGLKHGCGLNEIACMQFTQEDRQQFAQLIGYSLSGYSELSYVDDDAYLAATKRSKMTSEDARIKTLEAELNAVRKSGVDWVARLYGIHPSDLFRNLK